MYYLKKLIVIMAFIGFGLIETASFAQETPKIPIDIPIPELQIYVYGIPPYTSGYEGKISGPTVDEVKDFFEDLGIDYKLDNVPWSAAYERTLQRPNTLIFPLDRTSDRENKFFWIKPLYKQELYLYAKNVEGQKNLTLEDIIAGEYIVTCAKNTVMCTLLKEAGIPEEKIYQGNSMGIRSRYSMMVKDELTFSVFSPIVYKAILERYDLDPDLLTPLFKIGETVSYLGGNNNIDPRIIEKLKAAGTK